MKRKVYQDIDVLKRKLKMGKGDFAPGELIEKSKAQKVAKNKVETEVSTKTKVAIMGAN